MSQLSHDVELERRRRLLGDVLLITAGIAALHFIVNWLAGDRPTVFYVILVAVVAIFTALRVRLASHNVDRDARLFIYFSGVAVGVGGLAESQMLPYVAAGGLVVILLAGSLVGGRAALILGGVILAMELTVMAASELGLATPLDPAKNAILLLETATAAGLVALLARDRARAMEVKSVPGEGTCFDIELPRSGDMVTVGHTAGELPPLSGQGLRVLVIDDEPLVLQTVVRILEGGGYCVVAAAGLESAVDALAAGPVDVVLSDVMLPGQTGPEIVAALEERFGPQRVIFMSGYDGGVLAPILARRPDRTLLPKPFSKRSLLAALHDAVEPGARAQQGYLSASIARAANSPGRPLIPPPGWIPAHPSHSPSIAVR